MRVVVLLKVRSKAAAEDARAERAEKARKEDDERLNAESGLLKKLSKVAEGIGNPSETRAVDALGLCRCWSIVGSREGAWRDIKRSWWIALMAPESLLPM